MVSGWTHRIHLKHLVTKDKDYTSLQEALIAIADALESDRYFTGFDTEPMRHLPEGDHVFSPLDYANALMDRMYDYADQHRIWVD